MKKNTLFKICKGVVAISAVAGATAFAVDKVQDKKDKEEGKASALRKKSFYEANVKRPLDCVLATGGLIVLSPVLAAISIGIKKTSPGKVLFKQERVGKDQRVFEIYKFRTMVENAENIGDGLSIKTDKDPRITKIGSLLRKTSLDELPQLYNILKGDMSVVGPRPPVTYHPYNVGEYDEVKKHRFDVRPGLTGLAQSEIRNNGTWDERIEYDIRYLENLNFVADLAIIKNTLLKVFKKEGVY